MQTQNRNGQLNASGITQTRKRNGQLNAKAMKQTQQRNRPKNAYASGIMQTQKRNGQLKGNVIEELHVTSRASYIMCIVYFLVALRHVLFVRHVLLRIRHQFSESAINGTRLVAVSTP